MISQTNKSIKIMFWNANSIRNKLIDFERFIQEHEIDIVLLAETWLKPNDRFHFRNYTTHRQDRLDQEGGGVAILINNKIPHEAVNTPPLNNIEFLALKLHTVHNMYVASAYIPNQTLRSNDLEQIFLSFPNILIGADLNARHQNFKSNTTNHNGITLHNHNLLSNYIVLTTPSPTHYPFNPNHQPSTIDIFLLQNIRNYTPPFTVTELSSNHLPIITTLNTSYYPKFRNFTKTDWQRFKNSCTNNILINNKINSIHEIDSEIQSFSAEIKNSYEESTTHHRKPTTYLTVNLNIQNIKKLRNSARHFWQRTRNLQYKQLMNRYTDDLQNELNRLKHDEWVEKTRKLSETDNNQLWKIL